METLAYTGTQLRETIEAFEKLSKLRPERKIFIEYCKSLKWFIKSVDSIVLEFENPFQSTFFVDCFDVNSVAGGFIQICFLDWIEYENSSNESSKNLFDIKYLEIVSFTERILGNADFTVIEKESCHQSSIWSFENAYILVLQGADDIEGLDIRLWLEYKDENDALPDSNIFEWLCERHLKKIEKSNSR